MSRGEKLFFRITGALMSLTIMGGGVACVVACVEGASHGDLARRIGLYALTPVSLAVVVLGAVLMYGNFTED